MLYCLEIEVRLQMAKVPVQEILNFQIGSATFPKLFLRETLMLKHFKTIKLLRILKMIWIDLLIWNILTIIRKHILKEIEKCVHLCTKESINRRRSEIGNKKNWLIRGHQGSYRNVTKLVVKQTSLKANVTSK